jgi:hypothetical protein
MHSEAEMIVAFLFKRSGKEKLKLSEFYLTLSMELKWFPPKEANVFLKNAIREKLLIKKGDNITPAFDYEKIVVPTGFQPSRETRTVKKEGTKEVDLGTEEKIINRIVEKTDLDETEVVKKIRATEKERNISYKVAALFVARKYDINLEDFFIEIEEQLFI